jgi:hypothetical protein
MNFVATDADVCQEEFLIFTFFVQLILRPFQGIFYTAIITKWACMAATLNDLGSNWNSAELWSLNDSNFQPNLNFIQGHLRVAAIQAHFMGSHKMGLYDDYPQKTLDQAQTRLKYVSQ